MSAPVIWIIIPAVVAILLLFISEKKIQISIFIFYCALLALVTLVIKIDSIAEVRFYEFNVPSTLQILGRRFVLSDDSKGLVRILFGFNAFMGGIVYIQDQKSRISPLGLLFSCLMLAAFSVEPFLYSALIIEMAVLVSIPILYDQNSLSNTGGFRYLTLQTLGMPFILLTGWFLAGGEITPAGQEQLLQAVVLLGLGFISWLAIFPMHAWVPMLFDETKILDSGYIFQLFFLFLFLILLKFFNNFVWFREFTPVIQSFRVLGALMSLLGAAGSFFSQSLRKKNGYIILHIIGILMVSVGVLDENGISIFGAASISLWLSFLLLCISSAIVFEQKGQFSSPESQKANRSGRELLGLLGMIIALFSIAGMPLTISFSPTLRIYFASGQLSTPFFLVILMSNLILSIIPFNYVGRLLSENLKSISELDFGKKELVFMLIIILFVILGLFPGLSLPISKDLIAGFENLIQ